MVYNIYYIYVYIIYIYIYLFISICNCIYIIISYLFCTSTYIAYTYVETLKRKLELKNVGVWLNTVTTNIYNPCILIYKYQIREKAITNFNNCDLILKTNLTPENIKKLIFNYKSRILFDFNHSNCTF